MIDCGSRARRQSDKGQGKQESGNDKKQAQWSFDRMDEGKQNESFPAFGDPLRDKKDHKMSGQHQQHAAGKHPRGEQPRTGVNEKNLHFQHLRHSLLIFCAEVRTMRTGQFIWFDERPRSGRGTPRNVFWDARAAGSRTPEQRARRISATSSETGKRRIAPYALVVVRARTERAAVELRMTSSGSTAISGTRSEERRVGKECR